MTSESSPYRSIVQSHGLATVGYGIVLALFLTRFFYVAESAAQGDTLWIVVLWMLALLAWSFGSRWSRSAEEPPFGWLELSVGLLIFGHIISALFVIGTTGEKRSAINLAWEWVGVAIGWYLLRRACRQPAFRREILLSLIVTGTTIAGQGLYQHYVEFPQMSAKYGPLFDRLKNATKAEAVTLRQTLAKEQIPVDEPALTLFEKRLRDSREPIGLFALANTLGGVLAVCLVLSVSLATASKTSPGKWDSAYWLPWFSLIAVLGWCLLLTKSRTGWIATIVGLTLLSIGMGRIRLTANRLRNVVGILVILICAGWGLSQIGGLDRQVLTEAPKSLQYRLQYWSATWPMIKDHFWLGVGPGQFRSYYLFYKRPEASEEISDPHNLFLDVAANGGVIAFSGLLGLCVLLAMKFWTTVRYVNGPQPPTSASIRPSEVVQEKPSTSKSGTPSKALTSPHISRHSRDQGTTREWKQTFDHFFIVSAIALVAWCVLLVTSHDDRLLVLLPVALTLFWGLRRSLNLESVDSKSVQIGAFSAAFTLVVHLLGAGGIGMPAISLLLLLLTAVAVGEKAPSTHPIASSAIQHGIFTILCVALISGVYFTGISPIGIVQEKLQAGDQFVQKGSPDLADVQYARATAADPVFAEPWRRRGELAYRQAQTDRFRSNELFLNAVRFIDEAHARDPVNPHDDRRLGDWWLTRWSTTRQPADAEQAVSSYQRAWHRYPTNAQLMAELALALQASADVNGASEVAKKALEQDRINHERGHVDRYLDNSTRQKMEDLALANKRPSPEQ